MSFAFLHLSGKLDNIIDKMVHSGCANISAPSSKYLEEVASKQGASWTSRQLNNFTVVPLTILRISNFSIFGLKLW